MKNCEAGAGKRRRLKTKNQAHRHSLNREVAMLEALERQRRLTLNQWKIVSAAILGDMLDFFDFFLIGYVLTFIVKEWHLSFMESGVILLAAGVGAIPGAFFWGWLVLAFFRFLVGIGVAGLVAVDLPLVQEFVPSSKRGWIGGLVTSTVSIGGALGAACGAYLGPVIGWRGLFLIGLLPALFTLVIRAWVPESPRWLIRRGRREDARRSIAWALQRAPNDIELPATLPELQHTRWRELFKYPRSVALVCLTGLSQTSGVGLALWAPTLLLLLLHTTPAEASYLMIWVGLMAFVGRVVCAFLSDLLGRRGSGIFACSGAVLTLILAGVLAQDFIGTVSVFWLMLVAHSFFSGGSYSIIAPYLAEVWPTGLRASGMGLGYGVGNLGKIISPFGLALIVGASNFVKPAATVGAILPAMLFLAFWAALAAVA